MAWQSGGAAGIPGLTSDGANGVIVQDAMVAGDRNAAAVPDFSAFFGQLTLADAPGNNVDGDNVLRVSQFQPVPSGGFAPNAVVVSRSGDITAQDYSRPAMVVTDTTLSTQSVFRVTKGGSILLDLSSKAAIAGALSTVTDAAAKAVLTSIIAALTHVSVATDSTT